MVTIFELQGMPLGLRPATIPVELRGLVSMAARSTPTGGLDAVATQATGMALFMAESSVELAVEDWGPICDRVLIQALVVAGRPEEPAPGGMFAPVREGGWWPLEVVPGSAPIAKVEDGYRIGVSSIPWPHRIALAVVAAVISHPEDHPHLTAETRRWREVAEALSSAAVMEMIAGAGVA